MINLAKTIGIRVSKNLYHLVKHVSTSRGEDVSDFVRRAILKELARLNFASDEQKKALGITERRVDNDK